MSGGRLGLLVILAITLAPVASWSADEASPKGTPSESSSEPQESERRPLREMLYGATPEERERLAEERKRLSAAAAAFGPDPTAAKKDLGTGKYTVGPGGAVAVPMPRLRSLFFTVLQDFNSVGGDPSRANLHFMLVQPVFNTIWSEHWWTSIQGTFFIDWNNNRKTTLNLHGEVGHNFDNHWNVFAGAGAGVLGQDTSLGLDWTVQAGVRWVFRTPLFPERLLEQLPIQ